MIRFLAGVEKEASKDYRQEPLSLREELRYSRFGLDHDSPEDFLRSQWQSKAKSIVFLGYRWILGTFFGVGVVSYTILYYRRGNVFIFLTNWGFFLCGIVSISGAILVTVYHIKPESWVPPSCLIKIYWALYSINFAVAYVIATIYWMAIYPSDRRLDNPTRVSDLYNIWTHLLPVIFFTGDQLVVAQPTRLLHFIYPLIFANIYGLFTFIFYKLGGRNLNGKHYIYHFLDFKKQKEAVCTVAGVSVAVVFFSIVQYGVYRLRTFIARKLGELQ
ncbi:protein rolling stone [Drosophila ficusphila]|uniref:protein rolling stone n=1 Tax=Drosophila ficusphila TaxID=30025 RepID=UPI0007E6F549|nr:protein rolling stone [Drosophila ficusphila]